ncbi:acyl-CoA carboxylase subunit epsilon [Leifsonia sp. A12D58]|uniref:acyl-CoA carboxylase subunit epsilon n=1 Tax=Leifsonia sp. A12D58 TaxID=3397674 RepID=UPI0039DF8BDB
MTPSHTWDQTPEFDPSDIVFVTPHVSSTEVAAVTAVVRGLLQEESADLRTPAPGQSAWQKSQRALRSPLSPGTGVWRSFSG